ncbi:MAG TPA: hypothetical protein VH277_19305 [Gemmatimonadaceae bacterium]|nr:hypothetical protein [Gemmatimonadaceae bacterium]
MNASSFFPRVAGSSLDGVRFELPRDFAGAVNIVVVTFNQDRRADIESWMPWLKALVRAHEDVRIYELPTISRGYAMMRAFINGGMRRGVVDPAVRASTITLYLDKAAFRRALNLPAEDSIYVLVVDRRGRVYACEQGPFTAQAAEALERRLTDVTQRFQTTVGSATNAS